MQQLNKFNFSFSKWYLDCVDLKGNVFIGYAAFLKWKNIHLNYTNIIYNDPDGNICTDTSLKKTPLPLYDNQYLTWSSPRLNVEGKWHSIDPPIDKRLIDSDLGIIDWRCFQPKAKAKIYLPDGSEIKGLGYTEQILMNIKPWKLPIFELRWGRFLSQEDTIVWIFWKGEKDINLLFHQGKLVANSVITDDFININNGEFILNFTDSKIIRKGDIFSNLLFDIPNVRDIFPQKILNIFECKWRSKGILIKSNNKTSNDQINNDNTSNNKISHGMVIHEVVKWN